MQATENSGGKQAMVTQAIIGQMRGWRFEDHQDWKGVSCEGLWLASFPPKSDGLNRADLYLI